MDASGLRPPRVPGGDQAELPLGLDQRQIFMTNLQLLGLDCAAMEAKYSIPFNKDMFALPNKKGSEAVLYFLFSRLNSNLCRQEFRDCWPVLDKKAETQFRRNCCMWLQNIQKEEPDSLLPRINASLFLSPGGDKFCYLIFAFSTFVLLRILRNEVGLKQEDILSRPSLTSANRDLAQSMEKAIQCSAVRHRRIFMDDMGLIMAARQQWKDYADEVSKEIRQMINVISELERAKRDVVQKASNTAAARGSPAGKKTQFDLSVHSTKRAQKLQQVREMWRQVEGLMSSTAYQREVVCSILDKAVQPNVLDATDITISIPHLMLVECEQEIRRRQVENVYEAGQLNLISVLQLWNIALKLYKERLEDGGMRDVSVEAGRASTQAHTHQACLSRASALREKMAQEIPFRKKNVAALRARFPSHTTFQTAGLWLSAPSPTMTFEPSAGPSGLTPSGPLVQRTPDVFNTPDAARAIADEVKKSTQGRLMSKRETLEAFGVEPMKEKLQKSGREASTSNLNRNNSNVNNSNVNWNKSHRQPHGGSKTAQGSRLPQGNVDSFLHSSSQPKGHIKITGQNKGQAKVTGQGQVQPRVVRHLRRQPTSSSVPSELPKSAPTNVKKSAVAPSYQLASTPEKAQPKKLTDMQGTPTTTKNSANPADTPRQRAHNILADKIVWAVMQDEDEQEGSDEFSGPDFLHTCSAALSSLTKEQHTSLLDSLLRLNATPQSRTSPVASEQPKVSEAQTTKPSSSFPNHLTSSPSFPKNPASTEARFFGNDGDGQGLFWNEDNGPGHRVPSSEKRTPHHIVQEAWAAVERGKGRPLRGEGLTEEGARVRSHEGASEAEDVNLQDPLAALSEDAFAKHDLIHRSPLQQDIQRMWKDVLDQSRGHEGEGEDSAENRSPLARLSTVSEHSTFAHPTSPETAVRHLSEDDETAEDSDDDSSTTPTSSFVAVAVREDRFDPHVQAATGTVNRTSIRTHEKVTKSSEQLGFGGFVRSQEREGRSPSNEKEEEMSLGQTLLGEGLAFSTSFDDNASLDWITGSKVEERNQWKERTSALYEDGDEFDDKENAEHLEIKESQSPSFDNALDEMFSDRTPSKSRMLVGDRPFTIGSDTVGRNTLLSRSVMTTSQRSTAESAGHRNTGDVNSSGSSALSTGGTPVKSSVKIQATPTNSNPDLWSSLGANGRNVNDLQTGMASSQRDDIDRLLLDLSPPASRLGFDFNPLEHAATGAGYSAGDSMKTEVSQPTGKDSSPKHVTFSPDHSHSRSIDIQGDLLGDDELNTSGISPLDDSFTPLRRGFLLQGKSPARPIQPARPSQPPSQTSQPFSRGGETNNNHSLKDENLDQSEKFEEDIAARLIRLKKMTAEALRNCQESGADVGVHVEEEGMDGADSRGLSSLPRPSTTVGGNQPGFSQRAEQFDIFDEDDSVLLPASPS